MEYKGVLVGEVRKRSDRRMFQTGRNSDGQRSIPLSTARLSGVAVLPDQTEVYDCSDRERRRITRGTGRCEGVDGGVRGGDLVI